MITLEYTDIFHENRTRYVTLNAYYDKKEFLGKTFIKGSSPGPRFQDFISRYLGSRTRLRTQNLGVIFDASQNNNKIFSTFEIFQ